MVEYDLFSVTVILGVKSWANGGEFLNMLQLR